VGYTRKLILRSDSSYASYCHDTLVCAATFTTHRELTPRSNKYVTLIFFAGAPMPTIWQSIALEGSDTLHINDYNIADGYSNTYVRIGLAE
jgi:hypothetical protein